MTTWVLTRRSTTARTDEDAAMAHQQRLAEGDFEDARRALVTFALDELREWTESRYDVRDECVARLARLAQLAGRLTPSAVAERGRAEVEHDGLAFALRRV